MLFLLNKNKPNKTNLKCVRFFNHFDSRSIAQPRNFWGNTFERQTEPTIRRPSCDRDLAWQTLHSTWTYLFKLELTDYFIILWNYTEKAWKTARVSSSLKIFSRNFTRQCQKTHENCLKWWKLSVAISVINQTSEHPSKQLTENQEPWLTFNWIAGSTFDFFKSINADDEYPKQ